jgi:hypothetical protein
MSDSSARPNSFTNERIWPVVLQPAFVFRETATWPNCRKASTTNG